jgi:predicted histidine transporter YuiF (NhaC family)
LRDWIKDNATLLSNASLLISLATIALSLLPDVGFFSPYIKALLFAAALLLLTELHHQWPEDLQLHMLRKNVRPENHSWRMIGFALVMQVATIVFAVWATLTNPIILLPLTALAVIVAFYRWYFRRHDGLLARSVGIIALVAVLLISELLMVVVWAAVTGEEVTIELWTEDRPELQFND